MEARIAAMTPEEKWARLRELTARAVGEIELDGPAVAKRPMATLELLLARHGGILRDRRACARRPQAGVECRIRKVDQNIGQNRRLPTCTAIQPTDAHQFGDPFRRDGHSDLDPPKAA